MALGKERERWGVGVLMSCPPPQSFDLLHVPARNQGVRDAQWDAKKQPATSGHYWESETWDPAADWEMQHGEAGASDLWADPKKPGLNYEKCWMWGRKYGYDRGVSTWSIVAPLLPASGPS